MPNQEYRHEYKFLINEADAAALRSRLAVFMRRDAFHTESGGRYPCAACSAICREVSAFRRRPPRWAMRTISIHPRSCVWT